MLGQSRLLASLACSVSIVLLCSYFAEAASFDGLPFSKRTWQELKCRGVYDKSLFATVDRVCEDCHNLFHEPELHTLCRQECYSSEYYPNCLQALCKDDEQQHFSAKVELLAGRTFDILPPRPDTCHTDGP